jgi:hypothetical protein
MEEGQEVMYYDDLSMWQCAQALNYCAMAIVGVMTLYSWLFP